MQAISKHECVYAATLGLKMQLLSCLMRAGNFLFHKLSVCASELRCAGGQTHLACAVGGQKGYAMTLPWYSPIEAFRIRIGARLIWAQRRGQERVTLILISLVMGIDSQSPLIKISPEGDKEY